MRIAPQHDQGTRRHLWRIEAVRRKRGGLVVADQETAAFAHGRLVVVAIVDIAAHRLAGARRKAVGEQQARAGDRGGDHQQRQHRDRQRATQAEAERCFDQRVGRPSQREAARDQGRAQPGCHFVAGIDARERQQRPMPQIQRIADQADGRPSGPLREQPAVHDGVAGPRRSEGTCRASGSKARQPGNAASRRSRTIAQPSDRQSRPARRIRRSGASRSALRERHGSCIALRRAGPPSSNPRSGSTADRRPRVHRAAVRTRRPRMPAPRIASVQPRRSSAQPRRQQQQAATPGRTALRCPATTSAAAA